MEERPMEYVTQLVPGEKVYLWDLFAWLYFTHLTLQGDTL